MNRKLHVLVVEDDLVLGPLTVESLLFANYEATLVTSVPQAFEALRVSHDFDAILVDLRLGDERGETIFEKLKLLSIKYPPVILLSAQPQNELTRASHVIGAVRALKKPASTASIREAIDLAVGA